MLNKVLRFHTKLSAAVHMSLKSVHDTLTMERERVRQAWTGPELRQNTSEQLATLCGTLSEVTHVPTNCAGPRRSKYLEMANSLFKKNKKQKSAIDWGNNWWF